jgi:hypothetical protein
MTSVSGTCEAFRVRALKAEALLDEAREASQTQVDAAPSQDEREVQLVKQLQVQLSGIGDECRALKELLAQSENGLVTMRKKHQHDTSARCKAESTKEKEKDALIRKLQQALLDEQSLCDGMQKSLLSKDEQMCTKDARIVELTAQVTDAESAAKRLASEIIQLSHLPPIIDTMQQYLKTEADKMYCAGLAGGLENFAQVALTFLRTYRAGTLDRLIDETVAERRAKLQQNLAQGFEAGRAYVMESLIPNLARAKQT